MTEPGVADRPAVPGGTPVLSLEGITKVYEAFKKYEGAKVQWLLAREDGCAYTGLTLAPGEERNYS